MCSCSNTNIDPNTFSKTDLFSTSGESTSSQIHLASKIWITDLWNDVLLIFILKRNQLN